jgi:uncharacterized membrane protein YoaK (UPF0700 family)
MTPETRIRNVSLLLTFVAGYCDTVTFLAAGEVFSAHVTGNFIVLAYDLVNRSEGGTWTKLLTFPVFVAAVMAGGGLALLLLRANPASALPLHLVTMLVVVAMGLQNAFGRLYGKQTFGPTTVMTGTVTQAALDLSAGVATRFADATPRESLKKQAVLMAGFLLGCLLGAVAAKWIGLPVVMLPGLLLLLRFARPAPVAAPGSPVT